MNCGTAEHLVCMAIGTHEKTKGEAVLSIVITPDVFQALKSSECLDLKRMKMWGAKVGVSEDPSVVYVRVTKSLGS